nr:MAG TPA: hypothetical protein [Caudoviricetes sp.]
MSIIKVTTGSYDYSHKPIDLLFAFMEFGLRLYKH